MGKPKLFQLMLKNTSAVFYPGQTIEGTLTLELDEPLSVRALRVEFKGQATVHWSETRSTGKSTYTVVYHNEEHYFDAKNELWTKAKDGSGSDEMARGLYSYPFTFTLPPGLPSSFEGDVGHVRYIVKGVIDRRFRFDITTKQPFTVIHDLDLNTHQDASTEVMSKKHKFLCCCCCKSGPISATIRLPRKGFVPGEAIPIDADIENLSRRAMAKTTVKLVQQVDFHAQTKTRRVRRKVMQLRHGEIRPGGSDQYNREGLLVPAVPPSFLEGCRIIDIRYFVQVNVDPTGIGLDLKVPVEVTIGTIPLTQVMQQQQNYSMAGSSSIPAALPPSGPTREELYSSPAGGPGTSAGLSRPPPPTYSESVFGKTGLGDGGGEEQAQETTYAPQYTYYNWGFENQSTS